MNIRASLSSTAALAFMSSVAAAEPTITYTHPAGTNLLGGNPLRSVDCASLVPLQGKSGKTELFASCEFTRQVDANGQTVCTDPNPLPSDEASKRNHLSYALGVSIQHFGRQHGVCIPQAVSIDKRLKQQEGKNAAEIESDLRRLYGNYESASRHCPLIEAAAQCRAVMGLD